MQMEQFTGAMGTVTPLLQSIRMEKSLFWFRTIVLSGSMLCGLIIRTVFGCALPGKGGTLIGAAGCHPISTMRVLFFAQPPARLYHAPHCLRIASSIDSSKSAERMCSSGALLLSPPYLSSILEPAPGVTCALCSSKLYTRCPCARRPTIKVRS